LTKIEGMEKSSQKEWAH